MISINADTMITASLAHAYERADRNTPEDDLFGFFLHAAKELRHMADTYTLAALIINARSAYARHGMEVV